VVGVGGRGRLVKRKREREMGGKIGVPWDTCHVHMYDFYMYYQGYRRLRGLVGWNNI
jgi:hypothetical protein